MKGLNQIDDTPLDVNEINNKDIKNLKLRLTLTLEKTKELFQSFLNPEDFNNLFNPLFSILQNQIRVLEDFNIDRKEIAHILSDLSYINYGSAVLLDIPLQKCFLEVHRANMSKLNNFTGNPIYRDDGKLLYDDSYTPPQIQSILDSHTSD